MMLPRRCEAGAREVFPPAFLPHGPPEDLAGVGAAAAAALPRPEIVHKERSTTRGEIVRIRIRNRPDLQTTMRRRCAGLCPAISRTTPASSGTAALPDYDNFATSTILLGNRSTDSGGINGTSGVSLPGGRGYITAMVKGSSNLLCESARRLAETLGQRKQHLSWERGGQCSPPAV